MSFELAFRPASREFFFARARARDPRTFDRLMARADTSDPEACWPCRGLAPSAYGTISIQGKKHKAHRVMFALAFGDPSAPEVRHVCHKPPCFNPLHLRGGTHRDNMLDRVVANRGGYLKGESNGRAKLTAGQVAFIRTSSTPGADLARQFNVTKTLISYIRKGKLWKHLKGGGE
jgi:hypothetical protein